MDVILVVTIIAAIRFMVPFVLLILLGTLVQRRKPVLF